MYNYCVILRCRAEDQETTSAFSSACDGDMGCCPLARERLLRELRAIEDDVREAHDVVSAIRLSPYNYGEEHPLEFAKGEYAFIVADMHLEDRTDDDGDLEGTISALTDSLYQGLATYVGSIFLSRIEVSVHRVIRRREKAGYGLYEEKYGERPFREEAFRPRKRKLGRCLVC